jgi:uncharacterized protein
MMRAMAAPSFWQQGLQFHCTQCSKCCRHDSGFVFLSAQDLDRLLEWSQLPAVEFVERYCTWVPFGPDAHLSLSEQDNKDCVFWSDGGCSVYPARPLQCRTYPFWETIVDEEEHWREERTECPGIGLGAPRSAEEVASFVADRRGAPPLLRSSFRNGEI